MNLRVNARIVFGQQPREEMRIGRRPRANEERPRTLPFAERRADRRSKQLATRSPLGRFVADHKIYAPAVSSSVIGTGDAQSRLGLAVLNVGEILLVADAEFAVLAHQFERSANGVKADFRLLKR